MSIKSSKIVLILSACAIGLTACSHAKEDLGLVKKSPDEFAVVKHAPLAMPPDYGLQPPKPGQARPQEQSTDQQAAQTVFGSSDAQASDANVAIDDKKTTKKITKYVPPKAGGAGEQALLKAAGATNPDPNIRAEVDAETIKIAKDSVPVAKKILGLVGDPNQAPTSVVNPKAEAARLKKDQDSGAPITAGETPTVVK